MYSLNYKIYAIYVSDLVSFSILKASLRLLPPRLAHTYSWKQNMSFNPFLANVAERYNSPIMRHYNCKTQGKKERKKTFIHF